MSHILEKYGKKSSSYHPSNFGILRMLYLTTPSGVMIFAFEPVVLRFTLA